MFAVSPRNRAVAWVVMSDSVCHGMHRLHVPSSKKVLAVSLESMNELWDRKLVI